MAEAPLTTATLIKRHQPLRRIVVRSPFVIGVRDGSLQVRRRRAARRDLPARRFDPVQKLLHQPPVGTIGNRRKRNLPDRLHVDRQAGRKTVVGVGEQRAKVNDVLEAIADQRLEGTRVPGEMPLPQEHGEVSVHSLDLLRANEPERALHPLEPSLEAEPVQRVTEVDVVETAEVDLGEGGLENRKIEAGTVVRDQQIERFQRFRKPVEVPAPYERLDPLAVRQADTGHAVPAGIEPRGLDV